MTEYMRYLNHTGLLLLVSTLVACATSMPEPIPTASVDVDAISTVDARATTTDFPVPSQPATRLILPSQTPQPTAIVTVASSPTASLQTPTIVPRGIIPTWVFSHELQIGKDPEGIALSADAHLLAAAYSDHKIRLWDATTGKLQRTFDGHTNQADEVAFSQDGRFLASGGEDQTVRLWDIVSGRQLRIFPIPWIYVSRLLFSPDARLLISGTYNVNQMLIWDINTGAVIQELRANPSFAMDAERQRLSTGGYSNQQNVLVWDLKTWQKIQALNTGDTTEVTATAFHPNGQTIAVALYNGQVQTWDLNSNSMVTEFTLPDPNNQCGRLDWNFANALVFTHDGGVLIGYTGNGIYIWDANKGGLPVQTLEGRCGQLQNTFGYSLAGRMLVLGNYDGAVRLWTATSK